ncbi:hypothetical protein BRD17_04700 [Halobacteriales archaeon SW_7_68_16]|nr:MAG: hypothetical protein BRD17_04700 [Halobacteriales archaeon SW_7_68_16]
MATTESRTFYEVLEVDGDATQAEIEAAYRERVKETHPDAADIEDTDEFHRVVQAEAVLGDPDERETYDDLGHERYVGTVEGHNATTTEHSPWTTGEGRDRSGSTGDGGGARSRHVDAPGSTVDPDPSEYVDIGSTAGTNPGPSYDPTVAPGGQFGSGWETSMDSRSASYHRAVRLGRVALGLCFAGFVVIFSVATYRRLVEALGPIGGTVAAILLVGCLGYAYREF